jgi:predicted GIY-YIG superfamily endonuclease
MGKRYTRPTSYRDKECPYCGLYFSPRGLNGHIRFKHLSGNKRANGENPVTIVWQEMVTTLISGINTEEGLKKALRYFLIDYLNKAEPPEWMSGR